MARSLRWVFALLPCVPGLTLLAAAGALLVATGSTPTPMTDTRWQQGMLRVRQLGIAGGAVLLAGVVIGAGVAWRIGHPRPEPVEEEEPPPTE